MSSAPGSLVNLAAAPAGLPAAPGSVWRAPLVPVALVFTVGVVLDRYASPPLAASLGVAAIALLAALCALGSPRPVLPLVYLALSGAAFGAAYHHYRRDVYPADDVGNLAPAEPHPALLRGPDQVRPAIPIEIVAYDPLALGNAREHFGDRIMYASSIKECLTQASTCVIATAFDEFHEIVAEAIIHNPTTIIDCWRILDPSRLGNNVRYVPLGKPPKWQP